MKKVIVDQDKCIGCGACVSTANETFDFNEDGLSTVINDTVTEAVENIVNDNVCPVDAISIDEK